MRFLLILSSVLAFAFGLLVASASRSDIQIGMVATSWIGGMVLAGLASVLRKLDALTPPKSVD